jgi:hypothetical protein
MTLKPDSLRAQVLALHDEGLPPEQIATELVRSCKMVRTVLSALRRDGHIGPRAAMRPGSLRARCDAALKEAGPAGLNLSGLMRALGVDRRAAHSALRPLIQSGLARREADGLLLAAGVERAARATPVTDGERFTAMAPLARIEAYALTLARDGFRERAALFLRRAHDRLALQAGGAPPAAVNLLVLADLIEAPEASGVAGLLRTYGGEMSRVERAP